MTPQFPARRDAEDFASVLDGSASTAVAERYAALASTVTLLRAQPAPEPRAEFVTDLRTRLMAEADVALNPRLRAATSLDAERARRRGRRERHLGAAAAAIVLVGATTGMAAAAQGSLPGQTLYPLKRSIESVEVHLSTSDSTRGQQLLDQASTRLNEVRALVDGPETPQSTALVRSTLDAFTASADQGSRLMFSSYQGNGDAGDIATVRDFTHGTMDVLRSLATSSAGASATFATAGATLADIDQQARVLCGGCSDARPLTVPSSMVDLTSAAALQRLVAAPARAVEKAGALSDKARAEAARAEKLARAARSNQTPSGTPSSEATPVSGSTTEPTAPRLGDLSSSEGTKEPVKGLITGVVTGLPTGLGDTVGTTVDTTVGALTGLVGGTLNGLLGGGTTSGSTDGTTSGSTDGTTAGQ
jgi:hypothetical protein